MSCMHIHAHTHTHTHGLTFTIPHTHTCTHSVTIVITSQQVHVARVGTEHPQLHHRQVPSTRPRTSVHFRHHEERSLQACSVSLPALSSGVLASLFCVTSCFVIWSTGWCSCFCLMSRCLCSRSVCTAREATMHFRQKR